jgi:hypothetical protein
VQQILYIAGRCVNSMILNGFDYILAALYLAGLLALGILAGRKKPTQISS